MKRTLTKGEFGSLSKEANVCTSRRCFKWEAVCEKRKTTAFVKVSVGAVCLKKNTKDFIFMLNHAHT